MLGTARSFATVPALTLERAIEEKSFDGENIKGTQDKTQHLAQLGEGIKECELIEWFVKIGDTISEYDKLCTVQSDKATQEVTSMYSGIVKSIFYAPGSIVQVGQPLIKIGEEDMMQERLNKMKKTPIEGNAIKNIVPLHGYRRAMVASMQVSARIPHCYTFATIKISSEEKKKPKRLRLTAKAIKSIQYGVEKAPMMNARLVLDNENGTAHHVELQGLTVNVGIAIATPDGLVVPSIKNVENKSVQEIEREVQSLKSKASSGTLTMKDLEPVSNISVSNVGSLIPNMSPTTPKISGLGTIKSNEAAIVTLGCLVDGSMDITVGADHRFIDGQQLAAFTSAFVQHLQQALSQN
eukprot:jgi/Picsp_1/1155/NSC_04636-R1_dihydrolipoyl transacylase